MEVIMDKNTTIGEVVAALPEASGIFSEFGIDYCCGGNRKLYDVIKNQNINETEIYMKLSEAQADRRNVYSKDGNFAAMAHSELTTYIEDIHHSYLRQALPESMEILGTVLRVHGRNHIELFRVYQLFGKLKTDLEQHLLKEETMLFPALSQENDTDDEILQLTKMIINEHVAAGDILSELRQITNNYELPSDACETYQRAYELLKEIEGDLHQHIHLENNILLKEYDKR
jgi:regulator of cell morphogenesis and NO signaling